MLHCVISKRVSSSLTESQYLRPRWPGLYAARKKQKGDATPLPDLPDSYLGWIPIIWRITEQQVLAAAGLDAYVVSNVDRAAILHTANHIPSS